MKFSDKTFKNYFLTLYSFEISSEDVQSIVSGKLALRYAGNQIDAMKNVATASQHRSLLECQDVSSDKMINFAYFPMKSFAEFFTEIIYKQQV